jgi:hypothetical protein
MNPLETKLHGEGLRKDPAKGQSFNGIARPGDFFNMATIVIAKSLDHFYSGRNPDTQFSEQVRAECPAHGEGRFSAILDDVKVDRINDPQNNGENFGGVAIQSGRLCKPDQDSLVDKMRAKGLVWRAGSEPTSSTAGTRPDEVYDIYNMVDELDDEEAGLRYYLGAKNFTPSAQFPDRLSAIPAASITVKCDANSGEFQSPDVDDAVVTLGKRCYINQLREKLKLVKLERKPDINNGRKTYGPWFAGYIKPSGRFDMALMVQGKEDDSDNGNAASDHDEWGYTRPSDNDADKVFAVCDTASGEFVVPLDSSNPVQFAAESFKPLKKCSTTISNGHANSAYGLLAAEGLKSDDANTYRNHLMSLDPPGAVIKFVDAGSATDWSNHLEATDATLKLYTAASGFVKLVCSQDRSKPGQFDDVAIDRNVSGKLGQYCFIGDDSDPAVPSNATGVAANNAVLAAENLRAIVPESGLGTMIKIEPEETRDIMLDTSNDVQIEGVSNWKLNPQNAILNVTCGVEYGTIASGVELDPADNVGRICDKTDGATGAANATLVAALEAEGLKIDTSKFDANVAATADPEANLDIGTALEALSGDYYFAVDQVTEPADVQALCNKTDGTFTLVSATITALQMTTDVNQNDADDDFGDPINRLGKRCNLWEDPTNSNPGGDLRNAVQSYGADTNNNKPIMLLESNDFRAYWSTTNAKTELGSPVGYMWSGQKYSADFSKVGDTDPDKKRPGAQISLGNMIKANPETHQYLCASKTTCARGGPVEFLKTGTITTDYQKWLNATNLPALPPTNACADTPPANYAGVQCHPDNVIFKCDGSSGNFVYHTHDDLQLKKLDPCLLSQLESNKDGIAQILGEAGVKSIADDLTEFKNDPFIAPGEKLHLGTKLEAINDNRYYSAGSSDADVSLVCNGETGKLETLVFADGKEMQKTCDASNGNLNDALAAKGLKKREGYSKTEKKAPGAILNVGDEVAVDIDTHNDDYTGGASDDVTVACDGTTGKWVTPQVKAGVEAPTPQTGVATVLQTSVNFEIVAKCEVGVAASECVTFTQMDSFKLLFEDALKKSIDSTDSDFVRDIEVQGINDAQEKPAAAARQLSPLGRVVSVEFRKLEGEARSLQEASALKEIRVDYNIYLEPNVADKTVQSIIQQVAPSAGTATTKAQLHRVKLEREVESGLNELARAENARGKSNEIARVYTLAGINSSSRGVSPNIIDSTELAAVTPARTNGGRGGIYGGGYGGFSSREDLNANGAFSPKSSALMSLVMGLALMALSGLLAQ